MSSSNHSRCSPFSQKLGLLAIWMAGGALRFYRLGGQGLWLDEAFSIWLGRQPVGQMVGWLVRIDQHPPLYYALLHCWLALGDGEATVRALSALLSALTVPVIYLLGRRLVDEEVGFLAALILALSPFHISLAQEARMYALLGLSASLALYALARLLTDPRTVEAPAGRQLTRAWRTWWMYRRRAPRQAIKTDLAWLGYVVFTAATMWSHNTALFFPLATNVAFVSLWWGRAGRGEASNRKAVRNWLAAQGVVFLLWSPWLVPFLVQGVGVYREFWIQPPTWRTIAGTLGVFLSAFFPLSVHWMVGIGILGAGLVLLGVRHFRRYRARLALLLAVLGVPFFGELAVSLRRPIFYDRTLIWATIPLYLLLAAGLRHLRERHRALTVALALVLVAINGLSLREYYGRPPKEEWEDAAAFVAERARPDDLILFHATWVQIPFDYYFRSYHLSQAEHGVPVDLFDRGVLEPKMTPADLPRLRSLVRERERVWLVYSHNWYTDPQGLIPRTLEEEFDRSDHRVFLGLEVHLYRSNQRSP